MFKPGDIRNFLFVKYIFYANPQIAHPLNAVRQGSVLIWDIGALILIVQLSAISLYLAILHSLHYHARIKPHNICPAVLRIADLQPRAISVLTEYPPDIIAEGMGIEF